MNLLCSLAACVLLVWTAWLHGQAPAAADHVREGRLLYDTHRYEDALAAFERAATHSEGAVLHEAQKGIVRAALRIGQFTVARRAAERLLVAPEPDIDALTLRGDAFWAAGWFDEAESEYRRALALDRESSRARYGVARSLGSRSRLPEALAEVTRALEASPDDPDLHALAGVVLERLQRFDEAAAAYLAYADRIPSRDSAAGVTARRRAEYLLSFEGRPPLRINDQDGDRVHTVPFKLVNNKIVLVGRLNGRSVDWVLDTGAERTGISPALAESAGIRPLGATVAAGVGRQAFRAVRAGRADRLEVGSLVVRDVPVSIRSPAWDGARRWQAQSLSPISMGLSVHVDYGRRRVTFARMLPHEHADFTVPLRVERLPLVRATLNSSHPAPFIVDTGGEVISIGADTADLLGPRPERHIKLRVVGMSGPDEEAFLLPRVHVDFEGMSVGSLGVPVLNLTAPSRLLGFQIGGILGHKFLSRYAVAIDVARSQVRLTRGPSGRS